MGRERVWVTIRRQPKKSRGVDEGGAAVNSEYRVGQKRIFVLCLVLHRKVSGLVLGKEGSNRHAKLMAGPN